MARDDAVQAATWAEFGNLDLDVADLDDMNEALRKLERENCSLLEDIRDLRDWLANEKADQSDAYYYLHKRLDDNYDVISALERQLLVEAADREKVEQEYGRQIDELEHRMDEELTPLKEKIIAVEEQVTSLHEAAENKMEFEATKARLEKEIEFTEAVVESDLNAVRRKKLQEKQRVKQQVEEQIYQLSTELFSKKEIELTEKVVRAAENNEKLHTALQAKAKQAEMVMVVNQDLASENSSVRKDIDITKASEAVLIKRVRVFHDLVIGLKTQLEQAEPFGTDMDEEKLMNFEESLAGRSFKSSTKCDASGDSWAEIDTMSLNSDTRPGFQVAWTGGACGSLEYESVDELQVAVDSLKHLHKELQEEARNLTLCAEEKHPTGTTQREDNDPLVAILIGVAENWVLRSKSTHSKKNRKDLNRTISLNGVSSEVLQRRNSAGSNGCGKVPRRHCAKASCRVKKAGGDGKNPIVHLTPRTAIEQKTMQQPRDLATCSTGSGTLATVTKTPFLRRQLFYDLVEAFRDFQTKSLPPNGCSASDSGAENYLDGESRRYADDPPVEALIADGGEAHVARESLAHDAQGEGDSVAGCVGTGSCGSSLSDLSSVSVRTICEFGTVGQRSTWTQTVAKHFPEKMMAVRPARRLVVANTFLTTNSTFSSSTARSSGLGTLSIDSQTKAAR